MVEIQGKRLLVTGGLMPLLLAALLSCGDDAKGGTDKPQGKATTAASEETTAAGGAEAETRVSLTPEQVASAGLAYGRVEQRSAAGALEATAQIEPAANRMAQLGSRVAGRVAAVQAAEGDRVRAGQELAVIESPELGQAKAEYLSALASAKVSRDIADRERTLFERKISAEREWRQAEAEAIRAEAEKEAAEGRLHALGLTDADLEPLESERHYNSRVSVRSPITGVVASRTASLGQVVEPAAELFRVIDLREVWLVIDIYERWLSKVRPGQKVEVKTAATDDRVFTGTVARVGAVVEPQTRTVKVRVVLDNPDGSLRPGMFASARLEGIVVGTTGSGLFAPSAAIQRDEGEAIVFTPRGPGVFVRRVVKTSETAGGWVQVLEGVAEGDSVVTTGSFLLKSELRKSELGEGEE